ncbi:putative coatomer beta subunit (COPB1) protein [Medicago truncatula]|uniref:Adaptin amino-terminal region protein n=1 Tax=Medicago truncatula TaxID=3880 RepID=G7JJ76_MEDTR|nr:adaptin amino-terminal region protein [Medicago truncatula]RHN64973.1 putative coatomer beta subunit (COPB1) protein [Medicago truncatula]
MILFCEGLRRNIQSPNEFMRGVTLRFLSRINEYKILEHHHPFVRRNAILAVMSVYKLPQGEQLLINAPEIVEKFLEAEQDPSCKRIAFLMPFSCAQDRAIKYLFSNI